MTICDKPTYYLGKEYNSWKHTSQKAAEKCLMEAHRYASYPGKDEISRKKHIFARFDTDTPLSAKNTQNQWNNKNFDGKGVPPSPPSQRPPFQKRP